MKQLKRAISICMYEKTMWLPGSPVGDSAANSRQRWQIGNFDLVLENTSWGMPVTRQQNNNRLPKNTDGLEKKKKKKVSLHYNGNDRVVIDEGVGDFFRWAQRLL